MTDRDLYANFEPGVAEPLETRLDLRPNLSDARRQSFLSLETSGVERVNDEDGALDPEAELSRRG
ncbi:MAG TPA: hypothetical protein DEF51_19910 [Myxococcales bacterium]|nr:hypothetical protein [Myxococcales bacterium]